MTKISYKAQINSKTLNNFFVSESNEDTLEEE